MCDCKHLSTFGVEIKILDFRAKRGLKMQKRAKMGNKCGLVRFPTALRPKPETLEKQSKGHSAGECEYCNRTPTSNRGPDAAE